jgi:hypothetical protein
VLVAAGFLGLRRPSSAFVLVAAAASTVLFVHAVQTIDYLRGGTEPGVYTCSERRLEHCIGFLAPAVHDVRTEILRKPIANEPEFYGPDRSSYRSGGLIGWSIAGWTIAVYSFVAWFRGVLVFTRRWWIAVAVDAAIGLAVLGYLAWKVLQNLE